MPGRYRPPAWAATGAPTSASVTTLLRARPLIMPLSFVGGAAARQGQVGHQDRHRDRGHPADPRGLAEGARPLRGQLLDHLAREARDRGVVELLGEADLVGA